MSGQANTSKATAYTLSSCLATCSPQNEWRIQQSHRVCTTYDDKRVYSPKSTRTLTSISSLTRLATDMAATRRGCVQPTRPPCVQ